MNGVAAHHDVVRVVHLQTRVSGVDDLEAFDGDPANRILVTSGRLQEGLTGGYGYTGILVAFLARQRVPGTVLVAVLFAGLLNGGAALQSTGIPSSIAQVVQAVIIIFVLAGEVLGGYRLRSRATRAPTVPPAAPARPTAEVAP